MTFPPIAIVGRACLLPGANSPADLWRLVTEHRLALSRVREGYWRAPRGRMLSSGACATDIGGFVTGFERIHDPSPFSIKPELLADLDSSVHWLFHAGHAALLDAGITDPATGKVGVICGNLGFPTQALVDFAQSVYLPETRTKRRSPLNRFSFGLPVQLLCSALGLGSGGYAIDAACASSLYAIKLAADWLLNGKAEVMLAGGINCCDSLMIHAGFTALHALSPTGRSRPFHRDADGLVPAEGAALLVLKLLPNAIEQGDRILAVIRGVGLSNDGRSGGLLTPAVEGQIRAMQAAYQQSGLSPSDISLVECHATGTLIGDATEIRSMASVFEGLSDLPITALKSNIGHSITASGAAGIIRLIEAMNAGVLPSTRVSGSLIDELAGTPFRVLREEEPWRVPGLRRAAVNSFGFGGTNAHLLIEEYEPATRYTPLSAPSRSPIAVVALAAQAADGTETQDFISDLLAGERPVGSRAKEIHVSADGLVFPPRDLERALAQQTAILGVAGAAICQVHLPHPERTSVLIGLQCDSEATRPVLRLAMADLLPQDADLDSHLAAMDEPMDAPRVVGCMPNIPANRISRQYSLRGPSFSIGAEQLSGVRALEIAIHALQAGEIDAAIVGASDFCAEPVHTAASEACTEAAGMPGGDAAVALVLKRIDDAQRDGDRVMAVLACASTDALDPVGAGLCARVGGRFGIAHAAHGLLCVAGAIAALDRPTLPDGISFEEIERACGITITADSSGMQCAIRVTGSGRTPGTREIPPAPGKMLSFTAHPAPPRRLGGEPTHVVFVMPPAPKLAPLLVPGPAMPPPSSPAVTHSNSIQRTVLAMHAVMSQAHQQHLAELARLQESFLASELKLLQLLSPPAGPGAVASHGDRPPENGPDAARSIGPVRPRRTFSRSDLEAMASRRISDVFGEGFRGQDGFLRQVRMPKPPLLLADRVVDLDGEPNSMGLGSIITETDVTPDAWYLHQGYMPAGIAVEAGQADLLLISWLGIDRFNQGQRVYRLLGCELTFHGDLPKPGETLRYEIQVDGHASHGSVRMFSFHYHCTSDGRPRLMARNGTAGFFSDQELANSEGVLWSAASASPTPSSQMRLEYPSGGSRYHVFDASQVRAFAESRIADCFGKGFERASCHTRSPRIQSGGMLLFHTVEEFDPAGGPWGRGYLRARYRISPSDWFFNGHFLNDPCMPGTLMFEACLQAMAFYMSALGLSLTRDGWRFAPVPEEPYTMRCRGQVLPTSQVLTYEVFVDEFAFGPEPILYADVLATVDGLKAFHCRRLGLHLTPAWPLDEVAAKPSTNIPFDQPSLMACALGRPSHAFGAQFERFNSAIKTPRLPAPPYHFISRVTRATKGGPGEDAMAEVEYDIPPDAWYFDENGSPAMPVSVAVEVLLQPCGWLASFAGTWLDVHQDIYFRNLDGSGIFHAQVAPSSAVLRTSVTLASCSRAGTLAITEFQIACHASDQLVFEGKAVFGHFPEEALQNQTALPPTTEELAWMGASANANLTLQDWSGIPRIGRGRLRMIDRVTGFWPDGGRAQLGVVRAEKDLNPGEWFFKAHFMTDPVQPGSLGLEAVIVTLQSYILLSGCHEGMRNPRFEPIGMGLPVSWTFRGQVLPENRRVTILLEILEVTQEQQAMAVRATASLWVDGKKIYSIPHCGMRLLDSLATTGDEEIVNPSNQVWLMDHCPTYTLPVMPMMSVLDRVAAAAARAMSGRRVIEITNLSLNGWVAFDRGGRRLKTHVQARDGAFDVSLSVWREAPHREMSRYDTMATAQVRLGIDYPLPPGIMPPLSDTVLAHDPPALDIYEQGELFHGPKFHFLARMHRSSHGSSFFLDASAGLVPAGFLDQALFDGIAHGIPNENLRLWSDRIALDQVGYPSRIKRLRLFADPPADRRSGCEVRFAGFDQGEQRFPMLRGQLIRDGMVWAEIELVYALFNKGPLGSAPGPQRRAFLRDRIYIHGILLGTATHEMTHVTPEDVAASDWLPGTVSRAFGITGADPLAELAIKQHVARKVRLHPAAISVAEDLRSARCARFPITVFPVTIERSGDAVTVRDSEPPQIDCAAVRHFWSDVSGVTEWAMGDLHMGLIERFVRQVELEDPEGFAALRGKPVLYLANHQVAVESITFNVTLSALTELLIRVIAKTEHRKTWIGELLALASQYPNVRRHDPNLYFDRSDPASFFKVLATFRAALEEGPTALMAHADGTRALSCRARTSQVSAVLLDLAIEQNLPVLPVRFVGGLPAEPVSARLEYPFRLGRQDIRIGSAISTAKLRELPLADRSRLVVNAINALAPDDELTLPAHPRYANAGPNVLLESLRFASHLCEESQIVLKAAEGQQEFSVAHGRTKWIREFAAFLRKN